VKISPLCVIDVVSKGENHQHNILKEFLNYMMSIRKQTIPILTVYNNGSNIDDVVNKINDLST
jgi:hypothetical protein